METDVASVIEVSEVLAGEQLQHSEQSDRPDQSNPWPIPAGMNVARFHAHLFAPEQG